MKFRWRNYGLSIVVAGLFFAFWTGQALVGRLEYNEEREERGTPPLGVGDYLHSSHFWEATGENWESEFLQMGAFVFLTIFLFQKGSAESKDPDGENPQNADPRTEQDNPESPWPVRRGGWVLKLYENSLVLAFVILFLASFAIHAVGGVRLYNEEQIAQRRPTVSVIGFMETPQFWFQSLQNWQSEFLAIGSMVVLSIFLRQRGSAESKPVAAEMAKTGQS